MDQKSEGEQKLDEYLEVLGAQMHPMPEARQREVRAEVRQHLQELAQAQQAAGLSSLAATEAALKQFGDPASIGRRTAQIAAGPSRYVKKALAVAGWSVGLFFITACIAGAMAVTIFVTLSAPDGKIAHNNRMMETVVFLWLSAPLVGGLSGLALGCLGLLPGTGQTSRHGRTPPWKAMLWFLVGLIWPFILQGGLRRAGYTGATFAGALLALTLGSLIVVWALPRVWKEQHN